MKTTQYTSIENKIANGDTNSIRDRWLYGLRLLRDPQATTDSGASLRHGVTEKLIAAAAKRGIKLHEREIQRRIKCARTYPTEAQIRHAVSDFATWHDLVDAGFPTYPVSADEPSADSRTPAERQRDAARRMLDATELTLFPLDKLEPTEATVEDLETYAKEQDEITERFADAGRRRWEYINRLKTAVDGDCTTTWEDAHRAAFGPGDNPA